MKDKMTKVIVFAAVASAIIMLVHAFVPGLYSAVAAKTLMLVMFGLALVVGACDKSEEKFFGAKAVSGLAVMFIAGAVAALLDVYVFQPAGLGWSRILVVAAAAGLLAVALKCNPVASAAVAAASVAYLAGGTFGEIYLGFCCIGVGYLLCSIIMQGLEKKLGTIPAKVAAAFIICLASFAF